MNVYIKDKNPSTCNKQTTGVVFEQERVTSFWFMGLGIKGVWLNDFGI